MPESKSTRWRRATVFEKGSARLKSAMDAGDVTVMAAFQATRLLSHDEQDALLGQGLGSAFSAAMAQRAEQRTGITRNRQLTTEEWAAVLKMRDEGNPS